MIQRVNENDPKIEQVSNCKTKADTLSKCSFVRNPFLFLHLLRCSLPASRIGQRSRHENNDNDILTTATTVVQKCE